jgi:hypothetical protein
MDLIGFQHAAGFKEDQVTKRRQTPLFGCHSRVRSPVFAGMTSTIKRHHRPTVSALKRFQQPIGAFPQTRIILAGGKEEVFIRIKLKQSTPKMIERCSDVVRFE